MNVDVRDVYKPLPSQLYLHESSRPFKAYFGGFGSGKTNWLIWEIIFQLCNYTNNYGIIMRRTYNELDDTLQKDFLETCPPALIKDWHPTKRNLLMKSGGVGAFRSFDALGKIFSYNLGFFAIDQAEELPEDFFLALVSRMRKKGITRRYGLLSLNPSGHNWVWRRFIKDNKFRDSGEYDYVIAKTEENTHLPEGYVETLRRLFPPQWIARFVDCKFDEFTGLVFDNFGDKNIIMGNLPFEPKNADKIIITIDIGIDNPSGVLFGAWDMKARAMVLFDEIYESNLTIGPICKLIKSRLHRWGISDKVWKFLADPDVLKRQITSGRSAMQDFWTNGIAVQKAENNKDYGILVVNEMFGKDKTAKDSQIFVHHKLEHFLSEVYDYMYQLPKNPMVETNNPGKAQNKKDHLMGCLRYMCLGLPISWTNLQSSAENVLIYQKYFKQRFGSIKRSKPKRRDVKRGGGWKKKNKIFA